MDPTEIPDGAPEAPAAEAAAPEGVETQGAPEAEAAEAPEAQPEESQNQFLDALFSPDEPPEFVKTLDTLKEQQGVESWRGVESALDQIADPDAKLAVQQLLHNARNLGLKRADEASRTTRALEQQAAALKERETKLDQERAKLYGLFKSEQLQELAKPPEGEPPDRWTDPDGYIEWKAQQAFAKMSERFLGTIGKASEEAQAEVDRLLSDQRREAAKAELGSWIDAEAPDFWDHADDIKAAMQQFQGMDAKQAYRWVLMDKGMLNKPAEDPKARLRQARARMLSTKPEPPKLPENLTPEEQWEWYEKHPEAMKRDVNDFSRGTSLL